MPEKAQKDEFVEANLAGEEKEISAEILEQAQQATGANEQIEELQKQVDALKDALLRSAADLENTRKRAEKELQDVNKFAISTFAKDMVNVLENLDRTLDAIPEADKNNPLYQGVELTRKELNNAFERRGIKQITPQAGEKFDHNLHQAMSQISDPTFEEGCIVRVMQSGFSLHERLLRPAMVIVSKGPEHKLDTTA